MVSVREIWAFMSGGIYGNATADGGGYLALENI